MFLKKKFVTREKDYDILVLFLLNAGGVVGVVFAVITLLCWADIFNKPSAFWKYYGYKTTEKQAVPDIPLEDSQECLPKTGVFSFSLFYSFVLFLHISFVDPDTMSQRIFLSKMFAIFYYSTYII